MRVKQVSDEMFLETSKTKVGGLLNFFFLDFYDIFGYTNSLWLFELQHEGSIKKYESFTSSSKHL